MGVNNNIISDNSFLFKEGVASQSFDADANLIKAGKKRDRIQLVKDDDRFFIGAKIIRENESSVSSFFGKMFGRYVETKRQDGSRLLININSIASRLHLTKKEIASAIERGEDIPKFLQNRAAMISDVFEKQKTIMNHSTGNKNSVSKDLMNIIKSALLKQAKSTEFNFNEKKYLLSLNGESQSLLFAISQKLGQGTFGEVHSVLDITNRESQETVAMKLAIEDPLVQQEAKNDVKNEFDMLNEMHSKGNVWGIQAKPTRFFIILRNGVSEIYGYLGKLYNGDYSQHINNKGTNFSDEKLFEFHQLLCGLKHLKERGILHGDIKPANILVKSDTETTFVHIADMGGARKATDISPTIDFTHSAPFVAGIDVVALNSNLNNKDEWIKVREAIDVFAMGTVLYNSLEGNQEFPYQLNENHGHPLFYPENSPDEEMRNPYREMTNDAPTEIKDLIKQMLDRDYRKRPSATEAFETLNKYISEKNPALSEKINKTMVSNGYA